jgi:predicted permease
LVGVQVALCFVLVAACLMSLRGLKSALTMPLGLDPAAVSMASFDLGLAGYSHHDGESLRRRVLEEISRLPGVQNAAYANSLPLNIDQSSTNVVPDRQTELGPQESLRAIKYQVSPGFFQTLRIRMLTGRDFDWRDTAESPRVAIVNEAFVHQVLRARDGIGRHFRYGVSGSPIEIVGVVETGKYQSLTETETPALFQPILQAYNTTTVMLVRSSWPTSRMAGEIRRVLEVSDPAMPVFGTTSVDDMLRFALLPMRIAAVALGAFGLLAVTLAATGIYGVVAYAVARRRREIAIRVAVGATHRRVLQLVLRRLATCVAVGSFAGVLLALALRPILQRVVYLASTNDLTMLPAVGGIVALVALLACWVPARRALRLPPTAALYVE